MNTDMKTNIPTNSNTPTKSDRPQNYELKKQLEPITKKDYA